MSGCVQGKMSDGVQGEMWPEKMSAKSLIETVLALIFSVIYG